VKKGLRTEVGPCENPRPLGSAFLLTPLYRRDPQGCRPTSQPVNQSTSEPVNQSTSQRVNKWTLLASQEVKREAWEA